MWIPWFKLFSTVYILGQYFYPKFFWPVVSYKRVLKPKNLGKDQSLASLAAMAALKMLISDSYFSLLHLIFVISVIIFLVEQMEAEFLKNFSHNTNWNFTLKNSRLFLFHAVALPEKECNVRIQPVLGGVWWLITVHWTVLCQIICVVGKKVFGQNTQMLLWLIPEKNIEDQLRVTSLWPVATKPSLEAETEISLDQKHQI